MTLKFPLKTNIFSVLRPTVKANYKQTHITVNGGLCSQTSPRGLCARDSATEAGCFPGKSPQGYWHLHLSAEKHILRANEVAHSPHL